MGLCQELHPEGVALWAFLCFPTRGRKTPTLRWHPSSGRVSVQNFGFVTSPRPRGRHRLFEQFLLCTYRFSSVKTVPRPPKQHSLWLTTPVSGTNVCPCKIPFCTFQASLARHCVSHHFVLTRVLRVFTRAVRSSAARACLRPRASRLRSARRTLRASLASSAAR